MKEIEPLCLSSVATAVFFADRHQRGAQEECAIRKDGLVHLKKMFLEPSYVCEE